ncbi:MAG: hypothetical protein ABUL48_04050, partial [Pseudorhodoplanes sp.]
REAVERLVRDEPGLHDDAAEERGGHKLNNAVLVALMSDPSAYSIVEAEPARRMVRGHADLGAGVAAPAYGPDVS